MTELIKFAMQLGWMAGYGKQAHANPGSRRGQNGPVIQRMGPGGHIGPGLPGAIGPTQRGMGGVSGSGGPPAGGPMGGTGGGPGSMPGGPGGPAGAAGGGPGPMPSGPGSSSGGDSGGGDWGGGGGSWGAGGDWPGTNAAAGSPATSGPPRRTADDLGNPWDDVPDWMRNLEMSPPAAPQAPPYFGRNPSRPNDQSPPPFPSTPPPTYPNNATPP